MKIFWNKYTDLLGRTIFHPQFIMLSYTFEGVKAVNKLSTKKKKIIDIGAGRFPYKRSLVFKSYTSLDTQKPAEIISDAHRLPLKSSTYDLALMFQLLEYLKDPEQALSETFRILKRNSFLVLTSPFMYPLHDGILDRNRYSSTQLKYLLEKAKFKVIRIVPQGGFFDFWIQNLFVFWFKSGLKFLPILLPAPIVVPVFNISALVLRPIGKLFAANNDFPLNYLVIARKK